MKAADQVALSEYEKNKTAQAVVLKQACNPPASLP